MKIRVNLVCDGKANPIDVKPGGLCVIQTIDELLEKQKIPKKFKDMGYSLLLRRAGYIYQKGQTISEKDLEENDVLEIKCNTGQPKSSATSESRSEKRFSELKKLINENIDLSKINAYILEQIEQKVPQFMDDAVKKYRNELTIRALEDLSTKMTSDMKIVCDGVNSLSKSTEKIADEHTAVRNREMKELYLYPSIHKFISIYSAYYDSLVTISDEEVRTTFEKLFEEIEDYLQENGVDKQKSQIGEQFKHNQKYKPTFEITGLKEEDNTIKESKKPGFSSSSPTIVFQPEEVVVLRYDASLNRTDVTETVTDTETATDAETATDTETATDAETATKMENATDTENVTDIETATETDNATETENVTDNDNASIDEEPNEVTASPTEIAPKEGELR
jgi:hypothetical protein